MPNFPTTPTADVENEAVRFRVRMGEGEIRCIASREFFQTHYGAGPDPDTWVTAYRAHAEEIDAMVIQRFQRDGLSPVLLHASDT